MKYNQLNLSSAKKPNRVGRGISAGQGKTAGRGTKGQKARSGYSRKPGFEGGQNPLMQRFPKLRGFTSHKAKPETVYTGQLNDLGVKVNNGALAKAGLVSSPYVSVKLIKKGDLTKKITVELQAASAEAVSLIQKAGGSFIATPRQGRIAKKISSSAKSTK